MTASRKEKVVMKRTVLSFIAILFVSGLVGPVAQADTITGTV